MKRLAIAVAALAFSASAAAAATMNGTFWDAPNDTGTGVPASGGTFVDIDGAIAYATGNASDATFVSTSINYGNAGTNWAIDTLTDFLQADAGSITPAGEGTTYFQESVIKLTGWVALNGGEQIDVTSDDGFRLIIGGTVVSEFTGLRAPNNTTSATWNGGSGTFSATLWYFEGNETQAQLISNLGDYATVVPVPASALLLLSAVGGIGLMRRRRKAA